MPKARPSIPYQALGKNPSFSLSDQNILLWVPHGEPRKPAGCFWGAPIERTPGTSPLHWNIFNEVSDPRLIGILVLVGTRKS